MAGHGGAMTESAAHSVDWPEQLAAQLSWHWDHQLRPRLAGLSDEEYFWEPAAGAWNVRPRGAPSPATAVGTGRHTIDFEFPPPDPAPVTTIAWRLAHVVVGVLGGRNAAHFGGAPIDYDTFDYPGSAASALAQLDEQYATWIGGVRSLAPADLTRPCGETGFESDPMAALVLHIHREVIHHGAEIALLRDLFGHREQT